MIIARLPSTLQVYPYLLEIAMVVIYPVLLGITLASEGGKETIQRDYNFIVNAALAGVTLISMVTCYPVRGARESGLDGA